MLALSPTLALILASTAVNAHTIFQKVWVNGVDQGYLTGIRHPDYDGPITDVDSTDIICNGGPNPLATPFPTGIINIPAGATVGTEWHHGLQPNGYNPSDSSDPIDPSHKGPIMVYLAKVDSALQTSVTGLKWFKIYEDGLAADQVTWATDKMVANKGLVTFTMPSCIPSGNYFMRAELIALHPASSYPGAQFYMECAQINITNGGTGSPTTVSLPGAYKGSDPGITINIYYPTVTNYTIPGPRPFTCGGSTTPVTTTKSTTTSTATKTTTLTSSSTKPTTTSSTTSTKASTTSTKATSTTSTSTTPASTGVAAHYAQCGGSGYTGPTVCASPYVCTVSNAFYSQCL